MIHMQTYKVSHWKAQEECLASGLINASCFTFSLSFYYCDLWARGSDMLTPLTSLVGECGQTKTTKAKGTKKVPWHWDEVHQRAFNHIKATIAKDVVLAYPDYSKVFEIYTQMPPANNQEQ